MYDIICIRVEHMFRNDILLVTCAKWEGTHPALPEIIGQNEKKYNTGRTYSGGIVSDDLLHIVAIVTYSYI